MQLLFIRHGQSRNNAYFLQSGNNHNRWPDPPLTDLGQAQAKLLAQSFERGDLPRPTVLMTSLMLRAVGTIAPVAATLNLPVEGHLHLHEVGGCFRGEFDEDSSGPMAGASPDPGHAGSELQAVCPQLVLPAGADESGWYRGLPETTFEGWRRAQRIVAELRERFGGTDAVVAMAGHGWFFQCLLGAYLGLSPRPTGDVVNWFLVHNTSVSLLEDPRPGHADGVRVVWLNRTAHLPHDMITE
ncbi:MAG: phosphoglycerate mutase family protein [Propionibacteriaceae bacterium]|jgi:2,3-bisphosphoglycerate-dependent phosphoglycerate mutase|nr:phosphoglycerate mutase family protein [Propionibacteriaceae bacterium]